MKIPSFHWWRTVFFLIPAISVYTIVLGTLSIGSSVFASRGQFAHGCARVWAWLILVTTGVNVEIAGGERLSRETACVFVSNHQSIYDIPIIFASLPFELRIIAKDSLGRFPFLGWHLRRSGHLLVDRRNPGAGVFKRATSIVRDRLSLIVFPEGTRSADGTVGHFKAGIFLLAIQTRLPVVPLSVAGSRHVMKKGRLMTCPGRVRLTVHEPVATTGLSADAAKTLADRVRETIRSAVDEPESRIPNPDLP